MLIASLSSAAEVATIIGVVVACLAFVGGIIFGGYRLFSKLERVEKQVTPNGGDTSQLGDVAQRIEAHLQEHIRNDEYVQGLIIQQLDRLNRDR